MFGSPLSKCINCLRYIENIYAILDTKNNRIVGYICHKCEVGLCHCSEQHLETGIYLYSDCSVLNSCKHAYKKIDKCQIHPNVNKSSLHLLYLKMASYLENIYLNNN